MSEGVTQRAPGEPLVLAQEVHKSFGPVEVLKGINLQVQEGQVLCIIGPSGSGKSTFIRCINHLEKIDSGRLLVDGHLVGYRRVGTKLHEMRESEIAKRREDVGMVFQHFNLFPHMTVLQNLTEAPIRVRKVPKGEAIQTARTLLERVGLAEKEKAYPAQLSGGQQQRVAIARSLAMRPKLMLFDEPTSALDPELVGEVLEVMSTLAGEGMTMVVVTHEMSFAAEAADEVVFLADGAVVETGPPSEVLSAPKHERTRQFLARILA